MLMLTRIFHAPILNSPWIPLLNELHNMGIKVDTKVKPAECSIVIGGNNENPLAVNGKKILIYNPYGWIPAPQLWGFYKDILSEYYDEMISIQGMTLNQAAQTVGDCYDRQSREDNK